jgi:molybdate transport system substrate-binding protein
MYTVKAFIIALILLVVVIASYQFANNSKEVVAEATTIRVMAAASLTEVFNDLEVGFEEKYDDINLELNYAGSQALYSQIKSGVSADIFASANIKYMNQLKDTDMVLNPSIFAHNKLIVAVSKGNADIQSIDDLVREGVKLVIADESVPVGRYTMKMLDKQVDNPKVSKDYKEKFLNSVVSKELDVKSVVAKVELGEADAGIVYKTDINASNLEKVRVVDIADEYNVIATYPISLLKGLTEKHQEAAERFLNYLYSKEGEEVLEAHGFTK